MREDELFLNSWYITEGCVPTAEILSWVSSLNAVVSVDIQKTTLADTKWFYDKDCGQIVNERRTFFQICGLKDGTHEQPLLIQNEIGYLGILCKPIDGVLHFLMQAKIEPGNINKIQISPTIQATKSNFTQAHGGAKPAYLDWFQNAQNHRIIADQIQSEQSSRFLGKRNRNIIVMLDENVHVEERASHKWLTLGQIKQLMKYDNLVNMDTRTVLSCIPFYKYNINSLSTPLIQSIIKGEQPGIVLEIYHYLNDYKMYKDSKANLVPLYSLKNWQLITCDGYQEFVCNTSYPFKVIFCDVSIEGREVRQWGQPLLEATGMATFGLLTRINKGVQEFLVHAKPEAGCFDSIELGPTVQLEATEGSVNDIDKIFYDHYTKKIGVQYDVILSEEGGRFYHEQNHNVIIEVERELIADPPPGYWWCTYRTLNQLVQINNVLNIQIRNLLSLLEI